MEASNEIVERVFREASGRVLASLIRVTRDFDLAEDALQEAFVMALARWPRDGVPPGFQQGLRLQRPGSIGQKPARIVHRRKLGA